MRNLDAVLTEGQTARLRMDLVEGRRSLLRYESNFGWPFESAASAAGPAEYAISTLFKPGLRPQQIVDEIQQEIDGIATVRSTAMRCKEWKRRCGSTR